jgi:hypothetical protein
MTLSDRERAFVDQLVFQDPASVPDVNTRIARAAARSGHDDPKRAGALLIRQPHIRAELRKRGVTPPESPILADMRRASALIDEATDPIDYQMRLVALALLARQYLRELDQDR